MTAARGTLILVVGPSGAGKDTLLDGARQVLGGDPHGPVFATRCITRVAGAGGEAHQAMTEAAFAAAEAAGAFLLSWRAHGLGYGLPVALGAILGNGRSVVANVSRQVIGEARHRLPPLRVVAVTAPAAVLAARLAARGREDAADIERRLARAAADPPQGPDVLAFRNDRPLAESIDSFAALLRRLAAPGSPVSR